MDSRNCLPFRKRAVRRRAAELAGTEVDPQALEPGPHQKSLLLALIDSVPARLCRWGVVRPPGRSITFSLADITVPLMHIHLSGKFQDFRLRLFRKASRARICLPIRRFEPHKMTHYFSFGITSPLKLPILSTQHPGKAPFPASRHRLTNFKKESSPQNFVHKRRQRIASESHIREKVWIRCRVAGNARRVQGKLSPQALKALVTERKLYLVEIWRAQGPQQMFRSEGCA
jgi:hypothetical protein